MAEIADGGRLRGDGQPQGRPSWLGRIAIVTAGAVVLALVAPPASQASPASSVRTAAASSLLRAVPAPSGLKTTTVNPAVPTSAELKAAPPSIPGPTTHPATGKKTARALCDTEVPKGRARCLAMVVETNGVVAMSATPKGLTPSDIRSAYGLPAGGGAGMVIGIVDAFDDPNAAADLAVYRSNYGLPPLAAGQFVKVSQRGGADLPDPDAGWAGEIALDLDAVTAVAPNAKIVLVEADSDAFTDLGESVNQAVAKGAKFVSNSYGSGYNSDPGSGEDASELTAEQQYYNHPGVAVVASSGDDGYGVSFPASSQYVTSVGGTSLKKDTSPRGWTESVWNNVYGGPGSGCSTVIPKPSFQTDAGCARRSVADVSAVADPATGLAIYNTFKAPGWAQYGGTSLSSPLITATYALAGTPAPHSYPNSYPYLHTHALNDVTTGNNGACKPAYLCVATAGYDGPTGLGTPNGLLAFAAGPRGEVKGVVTDSATAKPIAGARLTIGTGPMATSAVTDAHGSYDLSLAPGTYSLVVSAYGYLTSPGRSVTVTDRGTVAVGVALTKAHNRSITGRVTDGSGHGYALYARISFAGVPGAPVYSDPYSGQFSIDLPSGASYRMTVVAQYPGYLPATSVIALRDDDVMADVALKVDPLADATPGYTATRTGAVQGFNTEQAPAGWSVVDNADPGWIFSDYADRGNLTGGAGGFATVDSDHDGPGKTQDSYLVSPAFDLTGSGDRALEFDTLFAPGSPAEVAAADLSTDNGATWSTVWDSTGLLASGHVKLLLPATTTGPGVRVRFHYLATWGGLWQVDNVFVGLRSQRVIRGGLVAGVVTDANTGVRLGGATVSNGAAVPTTAVTSPTGDPAIGNGFYWLFSPLTGSQAAKAAKPTYGTTTAQVSVVTNGVVHHDFSLLAGRLAIKGATIAKSVAWGKSATSTITLTNTGGRAAKVTLGEQAGGFVLLAKGGAPLHLVKTVGVKTSAKMAAKRAGLLGARPKRSAVPSGAAWQSAADYPTPIQDSAAVLANGTLYSVAGFDGEGDTSAMYAFSPITGMWTAKKAAADTREAPAAGLLGGRIVVAGGWGFDGNPDASTEIYNPATNKWASGAPMPSALAGSGHAVIGAKLYVVGGCAARNCGSNLVQVYDYSTNSWSTAADYPEAISWSSCGAISSKIYCAGGTTDSSTTNHAYVYNPATNRWAATTPMPTDTWGAFYAAANGKLIVAGGLVEANTSLTNQAYSFDPATGRWAALANLNEAVYRGAGALGFYAVGGSEGPTAPVSTVEALPGYDRAGDSVGWLAETPTTAVIAPGKSAVFTVKVSAADRSVIQPGAYRSMVTVNTDTPYHVPSVSVSMKVARPVTWGKVLGRVTTVTAGRVVAVAGATVEIDSKYASYTLTTASNGTYALWLDKHNGKVTMIVARDGYKPQVGSATVLAGKAVTKNWRLVKH